MPAPNRPRVPPSSCLACRVRRRKCDQTKPECSRCASAGQECRYPPAGGTWEGADNHGRPPRRKTACNACRVARKQCEPATGDEEDATAGGACARCLERDLRCTFPAPGEKGFRSRGPPTRRFGDDGIEDNGTESNDDGEEQMEDAGAGAAPFDAPSVSMPAPFSSSTRFLGFASPGAGETSTVTPHPPSGPLAPAAAPLLSLLDGFFDVAESLYPIFLGPSFVAAARAGRALPLAVDAAVLLALRQAHEAGDPALLALDVRTIELDLLAGLRRDVALVAAGGIRNLPARQRPEAVGGLVYVICWCHYAAMFDLAKELSALATAWAREADLAELGRCAWEDVYPGLLGARDADEARRMPLPPQTLVALRDAWGEHILPGRICVLLANMAATRRDFVRKNDPVPHELLAVRAGPCVSVVRASAAPGWDARSAPPGPLLRDGVLAWMRAEPGSPAREGGLAALPTHLLRVRAVGTVLFSVLRDRADAFIARCRAAGVRSPFRLGTGAAGAEELHLVALRAGLDADILAAVAALPPEEATLGAAGLVAAMEPHHGFLYSWQHAHCLPSLRVMRLELYSSFGTFLLESEADNPGGAEPADDVHAVGEAVANEIGTGGVFVGMLGDVIHTTQLLRQLLELNPRLLPGSPLLGPLALRVALINTFIYHRLLGAVQAPDAVVCGLQPPTPPDAVAAGLADDVRTSFVVLGALAARWPGSLLPRQLEFARRVAARVRLAGADVDRGHGRDGVGEHAFQDAAAALRRLLEVAYGARTAGGAVAP